MLPTGGSGLPPSTTLSSLNHTPSLHTHSLSQSPKTMPPSSSPSPSLFSFSFSSSFSFSQTPRSPSNPHPAAPTEHDSRSHEEEDSHHQEEAGIHLELRTLWNMEHGRWNMAVLAGTCSLGSRCRPTLSATTVVRIVWGHILVTPTESCSVLHLISVPHS